MRLTRSSRGIKIIDRRPGNLYLCKYHALQGRNRGIPSDVPSGRGPSQANGDDPMTALVRLWKAVSPMTLTRTVVNVQRFCTIFTSKSRLGQVEGWGFWAKPAQAFRTLFNTPAEPMHSFRSYRFTDADSNRADR